MRSFVLYMSHCALPHVRLGLVCILYFVLGDGRKGTLNQDFGRGHKGHW